MHEVRNLLSAIPVAGQEEALETLLETAGLRLERIVSRGHVTAAGQWYDQDRDEWVLLLSGSATLSFDDGEHVRLAPGDAILIPAHQRHRVQWTDPAQPTI
jgi:cupin 2 domain-containing protein